jgi:lambda repressor-like predicted transcriptional regulator
MKKKADVKPMNGLNEHRRISWRDEHNKICTSLAEEGFSLRVIMEKSRLTLHQVIYRLNKKGISLRSYRNGETPRSQARLSHFTLSYEKTKTG